MAAKTKKISRNQEIAAMNAEELVKHIGDANTQIQRMRFSHAITPIENPMAIRTLRKDIAKLKTEQRKKQLGF
ncbi:MAG: 50S ribosomal protein L29 [Chitinophagaceae bacterium]|nr:50S ribosomal protein L29 [Chitinophagaceae bacterium]